MPKKKKAKVKKFKNYKNLIKEDLGKLEKAKGK